MVIYFLLSNPRTWKVVSSLFVSSSSRTRIKVTFFLYTINWRTPRLSLERKHIDNIALFYWFLLLSPKISLITYFFRLCGYKWFHILKGYSHILVCDRALWTSLNIRYYFEHKFLDDVSRKICNSVRGVNRVCLDITSKPPSTIEWE